jgi:hypothetical protein
MLVECYQDLVNYLVEMILYCICFVQVYLHFSLGRFLCYLQLTIIVMVIIYCGMIIMICWGLVKAGDCEVIYLIQQFKNPVGNGLNLHPLDNIMNNNKKFLDNNHIAPNNLKINH